MKLILLLTIVALYWHGVECGISYSRHQNQQKTPTDIPFDFANDDSISINALPQDLLSIITHHLQPSDRFAFSLTNREFYKQFSDENHAYFASKFGIHAIDKLFQGESKDPAFAKFAKDVISTMPTEFKSGLINSYAYNGEWHKIKFMLAYGVDHSLLTYSIKRAAAHKWTGDLRELCKLVYSTVDFIEIITARLNITQLNQLVQPYAQDLPRHVRFPLQAVNVKLIDKLLDWASDRGHLAIVQLLLKHGADIHAYNDYALRMASEKGHSAIVRLLLAYGARPSASTISQARYEGRNEIAKMLGNAI